MEAFGRVRAQALHPRCPRRELRVLSKRKASSSRPSPPSKGDWRRAAAGLHPRRGPLHQGAGRGLMRIRSRVPKGLEPGLQQRQVSSRTLDRQQTRAHGLVRQKLVAPVLWACTGTSQAGEARHGLRRHSMHTGEALGRCRPYDKLPAYSYATMLPEYLGECNRAMETRCRIELAPKRTAGAQGTPQQFGQG